MVPGWSLFSLLRLVFKKLSCTINIKFLPSSLRRYLLDTIHFLGTSSPLGELFDHGCDAWAAVFIATTFYNTFGRTIDGNSEYSISELRMYGVMWGVFFTFHLSHFEKYNTSVMYLPVSSEIFVIFKACIIVYIYLNVLILLIIL